MKNGVLDYSRHYRNWHSDQEGHINKMVQYYEKKIMPLMPANREIKILDIGCGMGFFLKSLQNNGYSNALGIDSDPSQIESCVAKKLNAVRTTDTLEFLGQQPDQYDLITAFDVIEHIPADLQIKFVHAIFTALKKGGGCLLTTPNANSFLAGRNRYLDYTHHVLFTEVSLDFILFNAGFRTIQIRPFEYVIFNASLKSFLHRILFSLFRFFRRLEFIAELGTEWGRKVPLSFNLIAIAEKEMEG